MRSAVSLLVRLKANAQTKGMGDADPFHTRARTPLPSLYGPQVQVTGEECAAMGQRAVPDND